MCDSAKSKNVCPLGLGWLWKMSLLNFSSRTILTLARLILCDLPFLGDRPDISALHGFAEV